MVPMATTSGTTKSSSRASVITKVASQRRPPTAACTRRISGQVATTTIAAQIAGPMKGRSTHSDAPIRVARDSTPSVVWASAGARRRLRDQRTWPVRVRGPGHWHGI